MFFVGVLVLSVFLFVFVLFMWCLISLFLFVSVPRVVVCFLVPQTMLALRGSYLLSIELALFSRIVARRQPPSLY